MTRSPPFGQKTTLGCACFQKYAQNSPTSLKLVVDGFLLRYQTAIIAKYFRTKYKLLTTLRRSYADILAQTMSAAPLPPQPEQQSPLPPYQRRTLLPSPRSLLRSLHWRCSRMAAIMTGHHNCFCKEQTATSSVFISYWGRYHMYASHRTTQL